MNELTYIPEMHARQPHDRTEEIVWGVLDNVYNLLREAAVRLVVQELRETYAEMGVPYPSTDEETLKMMAANAEAAGAGALESFLDLAPHSRHVIEALDLSLRVLVTETRERLDEALDKAAEEQA